MWGTDWLWSCELVEANKIDGGDGDDTYPGALDVLPTEQVGLSDPASTNDSLANGSGGASPVEHNQVDVVDIHVNDASKIFQLDNDPDATATDTETREILTAHPLLLTRITAQLLLLTQRSSAAQPHPRPQRTRAHPTNGSTKIRTLPQITQSWLDWVNLLPPMLKMLMGVG